MGGSPGRRVKPGSTLEGKPSPSWCPASGLASQRGLTVCVPGRLCLCPLGELGKHWGWKHQMHKIVLGLK